MKKVEGRGVTRRPTNIDVGFKQLPFQQVSCETALLRSRACRFRVFDLAARCHFTINGQNPEQIFQRAIRTYKSEKSIFVRTILILKSSAVGKSTCPIIKALTGLTDMNFPTT